MDLSSTAQRRLLPHRPRQGPLPTPRLLLALGCTALLACDARFGDFRRTTDRPPPDGGPAVADGAPSSSDGSGASDGAALADSQSPAAGLLAQGSFEGRAGHAGQGSAELVRQPNGTLVLRFGSDFAVSAVPGPVVLLSHRDTLGTALDPAAGDLRLGALSSSSGAQSYPLPGADGGRRWAWVFCEPFAVEIARAQLMEMAP